MSLNVSIEEDESLIFYCLSVPRNGSAAMGDAVCGECWSM